MSKIEYEDQITKIKYEIILKDSNEEIIFNVKEIETNEIFEGSMNLTSFKEKHPYFCIFSSNKNLLEKISLWFSRHQIALTKENNNSNLKLAINIILDEVNVMIPVNLPKIKLNTNQQIAEIYNDLKDIKSFFLNNNSNNNVISAINQSKEEIITSIKQEINAQKTLIENKINSLKIEMIKDIREELITPIKQINDKIESVQKEIQKNHFDSKNINQSISYKNNPNKLIPVKEIIDDANSNWYSTFDLFIGNNNKIILAYFTYKEIILYDLINFQKISTIYDDFSDDIASIKYYNDNEIRNLIIASAFDKQVKIYDVTNNKNNIILTIKTQGSQYLISSFIINDNNNLYIIVPDKDNEIYIYDMKGELLRSLGVDSKGTKYADVYYENDMIFIIQCNNRDGVYSFNFKNNTLYHKYVNNPENESRNYCIKVINNITTLITSDYSNNLIRVFNFHTGNQLKEIKNESANKYLYCCCLWNDEYVFVGCSNNEVILFDIQNGKYIKGFSGHKDEVYRTIKKFIHPVLGECLLSHDNQKVIRLWRIKKE